MILRKLTPANNMIIGLWWECGAIHIVHGMQIGVIGYENDLILCWILGDVHDSQNNITKDLVCKDSKVCLPKDTYKIFVID